LTAQLEGNAMTFEEWFKALYVKRGFVSSKDELREAWEAATKAAYEECAKVCNDVGKMFESNIYNVRDNDMKAIGAEECAERIRAR
jgi:hypothetical protein